MGSWIWKAACVQDDPLLTKAAHGMPEEISKLEFETSTGHLARKTLIVHWNRWPVLHQSTSGSWDYVCCAGCVWGCFSHWED